MITDPTHEAALASIHRRWEEAAQAAEASHSPLDDATWLEKEGPDPHHRQYVLRLAGNDPHLIRRMAEKTAPYPPMPRDGSLVAALIHGFEIGRLYGELLRELVGLDAADEAVRLIHRTFGAREGGRSLECTYLQKLVRLLARSGRIEAAYQVLDSAFAAPTEAEDRFTALHAVCAAHGSRDLIEELFAGANRLMVTRTGPVDRRVANYAAVWSVSGDPDHLRHARALAIGLPAQERCLAFDAIARHTGATEDYVQAFRAAHEILPGSAAVGRARKLMNQIVCGVLEEARLTTQPSVDPDTSSPAPPEEPDRLIEQLEAIEPCWATALTKRLAALRARLAHP